MTSADIAPGPTAGSTVPMLVDTDVHENMRSKLDLLPYVDEYWQHYLTTYQIDLRPSIPCAWPYTAMLLARGRAEWTAEDGSVATDVGRLQQDLFVGEGVTHAILNGQFYPGFLTGNYEFASTLARAYNEYQQDRWLNEDERLLGSVQVAPHDPGAAADEIDRAARHPRVVQAFLPATHDRQYGDPMYRPIFEAAVRNDLAVGMHLLVNTQTLLGYPRYWLEWHTLCSPMVAMNQLMSLIANGVFDRFPTLKVVFLETGVGWLNWFMWRADAVFRHGREGVPRLERLPSEQIREHVRLSTQPMGDTSATQLAELVEMTDTGRCFMFSSDYPHFDADSLHVYDGLPDDLRGKLCSGNALETYPRLARLASDRALG